MLIAARMNWNFAFVETEKKYSIKFTNRLQKMSPFANVCYFSW